MNQMRTGSGQSFSSKSKISSQKCVNFTHYFTNIEQFFENITFYEILKILNLQ